jgi:hypothetical protein
VNKSLVSILGVGLLAVLSCPPLGLADDDDDKAPVAATTPSATPLTPEQRKALGIVTERPRAAQVPERLESVGLVLDPSVLVGDLGDLTSNETAMRAAQAEVLRLQGLYGASGGASLKMLEAARVEAAKAAAQSRLTAARFATHWSPLATLRPADRRALVAEVARGRALLLRADLPGRHSLGALPESAELDVDGVQVRGKVLGLLRQTDETQSMGLLVGVERAPEGLGPGARVPVALLMARRSGVVLPEDAVLYDEHGPYVFKKLSNELSSSGSQFERRNVTLLLRGGGGWLVTGVDDDDDIVTEGAGVLWSLEGMNGRVADDDDDD